jgi:hypothetical protein
VHSGKSVLFFFLSFFIDLTAQGSYEVIDNISPEASLV